MIPDTQCLTITNNSSFRESETLYCVMGTWITTWMWYVDIYAYTYIVGEKPNQHNNNNNNNNKIMWFTV